MNILLTRPLAQVKSLENLIKQQGHCALLFPTLWVKSLNAEPRDSQYDAIIFISANAVIYGLKALRTVDLRATKIFAVGAATAQKLTDCGVAVTDFPKHKASSLALLKLASMRQLCAQNILIVRGKGGVETLKIALLKQHNTIEYLEAYERIPCRLAAHHRTALNQFLDSDNGVLTMTSVESLTAFVEMVAFLKPELMRRLLNYPLIVLSARIQTRANLLGFGQVLVAPKTGDDGILQALKRLIE